MNGDVVHRLGAAPGVVLVLAWTVRRAVAVRRERGVRRRIAGLLPGEPPCAARHIDVPGAARRGLPPIAAAGAAWLVIGGVAGAAAGAAVAAVLWHWWTRRSAAAATARAAGTAEAARQLPLAAELLAACIAAGAGPVVAARAVGEALGGPVGDALAHGAAEVRLGGEPGEAWRRLAALPGAGPLARLLERAGVSGLPAAGPVGRLAADARADRARAATARARRAAVLVTAPVGLCFLPAFIAVGVLPVVVGLAGGALGGGGA
ncbi:type II secretion system F family protein [Streptomyces sp. NPDC006134]|uniref:type II secretion system F family protein n=1 Tax=Streptomyces sp. NPDC006134 TaxID=3154467 RepID=UPI0033DDB299